MPEKGDLKITNGVKYKWTSNRWKILCKEDNCFKISVKKRLCAKHGAPIPKCKIDGCNKYSQRNNLCVEHGAVINNKCKIENCDNKVQNNELCFKHGAVIPECIVEECKKYQIKNNLCVEHGARKPRCKTNNCEKVIISNGLCVEHGGKYKTCKLTECRKKSQKDGYCIRHHPNYVETYSGFSKVACKWLDHIELITGNFIQHFHYCEDGLEGSEFKLPEWKSKYVDGYDEKTKTIYEFFGNEFHGYPPVHSKYGKGLSNYFNVPYDELYRETMKKVRKMEKLGYKVIYIWEHEYKSRTRTFKKIKKI